MEQGRKELPGRLGQPPAARLQRGLHRPALRTHGPGFRAADWVATADGQALLRNNRPLLAYIAGKPAQFTSKDHNSRPGETVAKQLIVLNNSREP